MTVMPGTQKVTFNGRDTDYESKKRAAIAQSGPNSYVQGVQSVMDDGAGVAVQNTRTTYGNVNVMPQQILEGTDSNFQQTDSPGNAPLDDLPNQTGSIQTQASSTNVPHEDPDAMEKSALRRRMDMYRKAAGNLESSANDRSQIMRA
jgi:hypothetical protein